MLSDIDQRSPEEVEQIVVLDPGLRDSASFEIPNGLKQASCH